MRNTGLPQISLHSPTMPPHITQLGSVIRPINVFRSQAQLVYAPNIYVLCRAQNAGSCIMHSTLASHIHKNLLSCVLLLVIPWTYYKWTFIDALMNSCTCHCQKCHKSISDMLSLFDPHDRHRQLAGRGI